MIYENENYKVVVAVGIDYDCKAYLITNKATGVVEVETRLYPQAILYADQLNSGIVDKGIEVVNPPFNH